MTKNIFKKKKKTLFGSVFFSYFFLFVSLFLFFYFFQGQQFIQIQEVVVSAEKKLILSEEEVTKNIEKAVNNNFLFFSTSNIFLARKSKIINKIKEEEPTAKEVVVEKFFPSKLKVEIISRKPEVIFCKEKELENCFYVDEEGVVFKKAEEKENFIFFINNNKFNLGDQLIKKEAIENLFYLEKEISLLGFDVFLFDLSDKKTTEVIVNNNLKIIFSNDNFKENIEKLKLVVKKTSEEGEECLEYINLKIKDKVYCK
jgi:cell division septal protein FtsQ